MSQKTIVVTNQRIGIYSFTTGFVASPRPTPKTEDEVLNHAHWLERRGYKDEADKFVDDYLNRRRLKK